jgi:hydrogenase expression/formation protein HypC
VCRGVPGRILSIDGEIGQVDFWGTVKAVRLELVDEPVAVDDYVLCSLGCALRRIPPEDVEELLGLYADVVGAELGRDASSA